MTAKLEYEFFYFFLFGSYPIAHHWKLLQIKIHLNNTSLLICINYSLNWLKHLLSQMSPPSVKRKCTAFISYTFNIFCHSILIETASPCSTGNCLEKKEQSLALHIRMNHLAIRGQTESSGKHQREIIVYSGTVHDLITICIEVLNVAYVVQRIKFSVSNQ